MRSARGVASRRALKNKQHQARVWLRGARAALRIAASGITHQPHSARSALRIIVDAATNMRHRARQNKSICGALASIYHARGISK